MFKDCSLARCDFLVRLPVNPAAGMIICGTLKACIRESPGRIWQSIFLYGDDGIGTDTEEV